MPSLPILHTKWSLNKDSLLTAATQFFFEKSSSTSYSRIIDLPKTTIIQVLLYQDKNSPTAQDLLLTAAQFLLERSSSTSFLQILIHVLLYQEFSPIIECQSSKQD